MTSFTVPYEFCRKFNAILSAYPYFSEAVKQNMTPENTLIVYGSLAPGRANHSFIEHLKGQWKKGVVFGKLVEKGWGSRLGFPGFARSEQPDAIEVHMLFSNQLPGFWDQLDDFEGEEYQREVVSFELEDGKTGEGFMYILKPGT